MSAFTIKDLEQFSGVKAHTIRIWEQRYHFLKPQRTTTNIRYYCCEELKTVLDISLLTKSGYRISQIDKMSCTEISEKINELATEERIVNDLVQEMASMNIDAFETIISKYTEARGIEKTIDGIIFPFLDKTGILWETGTIHPAREQLVSNIIRQKLIVAIETMNVPVKSPDTSLLYLPENVYKELGLLYIYYLLKKNGETAIYLGSNVPFSDVEYVIKTKKPVRAFIHLTEGSSHFNFGKLLTDIQKKSGSLTTIVSGQLAQQHRGKIPPGIELIRSLSSLAELLSA